jgi:hypothetical protein
MSAQLQFLQRNMMEVLTLIGDGSIDRSALQDMGTWPIRISDS